MGYITSTTVTQLDTTCPNFGEIKQHHGHKVKPICNFLSVNNGNLPPVTFTFTAAFIQLCVHVFGFPYMDIIHWLADWHALLTDYAAVAVLHFSSK